MAQRFQIEDLVVQDESGVIFRAIDSETGQTVALRRFFPRGANGGGLSADEQTAYHRVLERLVGIGHPSLRSIICGGCDPVDGMPFMATEWIEGAPLSLFLTNDVVADNEAAALLDKALELSQLLSEALGEEAIWVETDLQSIIFGPQGAGHGTTFWFSPFKCFRQGSLECGLESLSGLTEEIMGSNGRLIGAQNGTVLGGWLRWLRGAANTTTLHEVREKLAASLGEAPPVTGTRPAGRMSAPSQAAGTKKKSRSRASMVLIIASLALGLGLGGWSLSRRNAAAQPAQVTNAFEIMNFADLQLDGLPTAAAAAAVRKPNTARNDPDFDELRAEVSRRGEIYSVADYELLMRKNGEEVSFEGLLKEISPSQSQKTIYLLFSENASSIEPRGGVLLSSAAADLTAESIAPFAGKRIRLRGKVKVERIPQPGRPVIFITQRAAIEEVE